MIGDIDGLNAEQAFTAMRDHPRLMHQVAARISADGDWLALQVRTGDIGTAQAPGYRTRVLSAAEQILGSDYAVDIVGQWWLSQTGMRLILGDMMRSLFTALLVVLPILFLASRNLRLFAAGAIANLVPLLIPLSFMAATGITVRIGTAVVLAIALGIAVDNTLHVMTRLRSLAVDGRDPLQHVGTMMRGTGRAVVYTTLALTAGFLSMITNQLDAIHDMGLVAAVTFVAALLADLLLLPAVYVVLKPRT